MSLLHEVFAADTLCPADRPRWSGRQSTATMAASPSSRIHMSDVVTTGELLEVLLRAEEPDQLGQKIAKALSLIEKVMDDLG